MAGLTRFKFLLVGIVVGLAANGQTMFSLSSDFNLQRSLKKGQEYWAVGQTLTLHYNFSPADGAYISAAYFSNGRFTDPLVAQAKGPLTIPSTVSYENHAKMRFKQVSIGWKHYFTGAVNSERGVSFYSQAGLGILLGLVQNTHSVVVDTASYQLPVLAGRENFKRLTVDLGLGAEYPIGPEIYFFGELKTILPLTDYPSPYILDNKYTPYTAMAAIGFRLFFN